MTRIKREKKIGYKIVFENNDRLLSLVSIKMITYELNRRVFKRLQHGPLAVFDTLEKAMEFIYPSRNDGQSPYYKIYKCEYRESIYTQLWFSENEAMKRKFLPEGTRFADNVKLTKFITSSDQLE